MKNETGFAGQILSTRSPITPEQVIAHLRRAAADKTVRRRKMTEGYVYFCGPADGPIKIGFSRDPGERLYRLQTSHPERLYLWAETPGTEATEDRYHARFANLCLGSEWFARHDDILAEIAYLNQVAECAA